MRSTRFAFVPLAALALTIFCPAGDLARAATPAAEAARFQPTVKTLTPAIAPLKVLGRLNPSTTIRLSLLLAITRSAELHQLIGQLYDPRSPRYRQFLTPAQFEAQFAPSTEAYDKVVAWAKSRNLTIVATASNRLVLDVAGPARDVERALNVELHTAARADGSRFYRPDREPSFDLDLPIHAIIGLTDFPRPRVHGGSAPNGTYMSADLRNAYLPGSRLTGDGQTIGILAYDGYKPSDIAGYRSQAHLAALAPSNVLAPTATGMPSTNTSAIETTADIELAMAMAPAANVVAYIGTVCNDEVSLLNKMAASSPLSLQNSTSFGLCNTMGEETIFDTLSVQGQSFFVPSGDQGGYPSGSQPYGSYPVTVVGGTNLTMNGVGASWMGETPWNDTARSSASGGGVEFEIPIPAWQTGTTFNAGSGASTTNRNDPDVAMVAQGLYIVSTTYPSPVNGWEGTSASTPEWAGFMALVNEQYQHLGHTAVGWASPPIWDTGRSSAYGAAFNDITSSTPTPTYITNGIAHTATPGYDLVTGWGTPTTGLIDQLACVTMGSSGLVLSTPPNCDALATSWGDPHITTFGGTYYDFQAAGDFLATSDGATFVVQTRQQWAPNWPEVAINKAVATRVGKTRIAVMLDPTRLVIDGKQTPLADGKSLALPDGVEVTLAGGAYTLRLAGKSFVLMQVMNSTWVGGDFINLTVGMKKPPVDKMQGVLGSRNDFWDDGFTTREGIRLGKDIAFRDLYNRFADSWRVPPAESLFGEDAPPRRLVADKMVLRLRPNRPFLATDLPKPDYAAARALCVSQGISIDTLLDACALDVAVSGNPAQAKVYAGALHPARVMKGE